MKLFTSILSIGLLVAGIARAERQQETQKHLYKVTLVNLTKGQPFTPPVVAVHAPGHSVVHLAHEESPGLAALAKDGATDLFQEELEYDNKVVRSVVGDGFTMPGLTLDVTVEANNPRYKLTLVTMLARTNDAIVVAKDLSLKLRPGQKAVYLANTYDAGVEDNTELCAHIPAPPCNNPNVDAGIGEGFIRPHEGLLQVGDLLPERDAFANNTAKVIVERIQ